MNKILMNQLLKEIFMKKIIIASLMAIAAGSATAEETSSGSPLADGLYLGGGISYNDLDAGSIFDEIDNASASGFQLFAGLPIASSIKGFETFVELGYFQTNTFKLATGVKERVKGVSGSLVLQRNLNEIDPNLYGLARVGAEIGDDDGILMGVGAGYRLSPKVEFRAEFVNKDLVTSYQANALVRF
jgi:hypothetical protein